VSVETSAQALTALAPARHRDRTDHLNAFRRKPLDEVLPPRPRPGSASIARVPLASGLLSAATPRDTTFAAGDHPLVQPARRAFASARRFPGDFESRVERRRAIRHPGAAGRDPGARWRCAGSSSSPGLPRHPRRPQPSRARLELPRRSDPAAAGEPALDAIETLYDKYYPRIRCTLASARGPSVATARTWPPALARFVLAGHVLRGPLGNRDGAGPSCPADSLPPLLTPSRRDGLGLKMNFADNKWLRVPGRQRCRRDRGGRRHHGAPKEPSSTWPVVRNVGNGDPLLHGWHFHPDGPRQRRPPAA